LVPGRLIVLRHGATLLGGVCGVFARPPTVAAVTAANPGATQTARRRVPPETLSGLAR